MFFLMTRLRLMLVTVRDWLPTVMGFIFLALLSVVLAFWLLDPMPPKKLVIATAGEQSAYQVLGRRYHDELKKYGITVELKTTQGSVENLALLQKEDSGVDVAFVQGGTWQAPLDEDGNPLVELQGLGGLFPEPVWVFYREDSAQRLLKCVPQDDNAVTQHGGRPTKLRLAQAASEEPDKVVTHTCGVLPGLHALRHWRVNIGAENSGVQVLGKRLLETAGLDANDLTILHQPNTPAVVDLLEGRTDAMFFVSAPEAPLIQMLLLTPGIKLMNFEQASAFSRKLPFLSVVTLPRGVVDLGRDLPEEDIHLVAPTATLASREGLHPALSQLLVQAAGRIHSVPGWFAKAGEFPQAGGSDVPLADEAARYYKGGKPLLQRYMPFWLSNLIDRMWVALLSIMVVLIPLSRLVPPLYVFRMRSRVFRWYADLRKIESAYAAAAATAEHDRSTLLAELATLDERVGQIQVPLSYTEELYALRQNIALVRDRIRAGLPLAAVAPLDEVGDGAPMGL